MKKVLYIASLVLVAACTTLKEGDRPFANVVYLTGDVKMQDIRVGEADGVITRSVSVSMAVPETSDVQVSVGVQPSLLDTYRLVYSDPDAKLLPEANYVFPEGNLSMSAGFVTSSSLQIQFKNVPSLDLSTHYVLPVGITTAGVNVLESGRTIYYVFSKAALVNVVADLTENRAWPYFDNQPTFKDMATFTFEALINATTFKRVGGDGNKIEHPLATVMGVEDRFLIRVGDTLIPENQIQVAIASKDDKGETHRAHISNAAMQIKAGQWYHIAVTFDNGVAIAYLDGKLVGQSNPGADMGVTKVDFSTVHSEEDDGKPRCFWIGYSYDKWRYWNGRLSEVRIWNKALTEEEINAPNHFYQVSPTSEGLVAYWKFDDGAGSKVKDYSPLGNDLVSQSPLTWYPVFLPKE